MVHPMPEIKAVGGRSVHIICPASGYPLDKIFWSKGYLSLKASPWLVNKQKISPGENELSSSGRLSVFPNGSLVSDFIRIIVMMTIIFFALLIIMMIIITIIIIMMIPPGVDFCE